MFKRRGRYGQLIKWLISAVDLLLLNVFFFVVGCFLCDSDIFFSKHSWLMLNVALLVSDYLFASIHEQRVVYADRLLLEVVKLLGVHMGLYLTLMTFLDFGEVEWQMLVKFYLPLFFSLSAWWLGSRKVIKSYRRKGFNYKRVVVIGGGQTGERMIEELMADDGYGYQVEGFFDNNPRSFKNPYFKGSLSRVEEFLQEYVIDEMFCALSTNDRTDLTRMIRYAEQNAVDFYYIPQFNREVTRRFYLSSIGPMPVLAIRPYPLSNPLNRFVKRLFDIVFSLIIAVLSPLIFLPVAIGIKLSSPGPILFKQVRTGYRGKEFTCYKFRTMHLNDMSDVAQATEHDPRKFRFGDFLRRSSIDEIPQFFNVLRGDMSVVGPRPHMVAHTEIYSGLIEKYMLRHTIKPGITGWAQVTGYRGQTDQLWKMEKRVEADVWYAEHWNFLLDLKIIFLTIWNAIRGESNAF